ncbi:hypothetical protein I5515_00310 [Acinetobacter calcoaceticus]|uniref:hypothetical protein n=1 Tax=Acinetobacter calcoaceticus TaxID=471 RepID=UPI001900526E|nr:hypothetical protein [Acinetobacter calcoaceticus]MBJ9720243.1 hypothetical protein [Acinetobacter calcoaceticus]
MKKVLLTSLIALTLGINGCATIVSGSSQIVTFTSVPESATIEIKNRKGVKIHTGQTPVTVSLKKGAGYFKPESYQVSFSKSGYQSKTVEVTGALSGWYFGNILFGGLIGILIVDPATGAMFRLAPKDVNTVLESQNLSTESQKDPTLTVMLAEEVPVQIMARAIQIK